MYIWQIYICHILNKKKKPWYNHFQEFLPLRNYLEGTNSNGAQSCWLLQKKKPKKLNCQRRAADSCQKFSIIIISSTIDLPHKVTICWLLRFCFWTSWTKCRTTLSIINRREPYNIMEGNNIIIPHEVNAELPWALIPPHLPKISQDFTFIFLCFLLYVKSNFEHFLRAFPKFLTRQRHSICRI